MEWMNARRRGWRRREKKQSFLKIEAHRWMSCVYICSFVRSFDVQCELLAKELILTRLLFYKLIFCLWNSLELRKWKPFETAMVKTGKSQCDVEAESEIGRNDKHCVCVCAYCFVIYQYNRSHIFWLKINEMEVRIDFERMHEMHLRWTAIFMPEY